MFLSRLFLAVLLVFPSIAISQVQRTPGALAKTDFSGRWRMVKELSDFHGFSMPNIVVRIVDYHDPALNVHTIQTTGEKTNTTDITYFTDGSINKNVINGRDAESKCYWDGAVLVVRTSMKNSKGDEQLITDRWELSEDKQTLTISSHVETDKGEVDMKMVCARQKVAG
jgi:hypothetical protein